MDAALTKPRTCRVALLAVALSPVIPQLLGSAFNIWYNIAVIDPLLFTAQLKQRFVQVCVFYNAIAYPIAIYLWVRCVYSFRPACRRLQDGQELAGAALTQWRRAVINLPWVGGLISAAGWLLCIPVFLAALWAVEHRLDPRLWWHLPISFSVSAFISVTHSFFLIELASHRALFPVLFRDARADQTPGVVSLSLKGRGVLWAISAGLCPIGSLLLLSFAPPSPGSNPQWFAIFVGTIGIAFGLCTALMIGWMVAEPLDHLRTAAQAVGQGRFDVEVPLRRADEFGLLIGEFNHMIRELRDKERLRQTFGLHVGRKAAEQILMRDPGLGGVEQEVTVMFVDIRSFTARSETDSPSEVVAVLNEFLKVMVAVVEEEHGGMVNTFLGDGFVALFGVGDALEGHAATAVGAGKAMVKALEGLNERLAASGRKPIAMGVGIHTGRAVVGSIGSPQRLGFTAIGSTVNLASRIEGLTKSLGSDVLMTHSTWGQLKDRSGWTAFPPQPVRGVAEPVQVYGLAKETAAIVSDFAAGNSVAAEALDGRPG